MNSYFIGDPIGTVANPTMLKTMAAFTALQRSDAERSTRPEAMGNCLIQPLSNSLAFPCEVQVRRDHYGLIGPQLPVLIINTTNDTSEENEKPLREKTGFCQYTK